MARISLAIFLGLYLAPATALRADEKPPSDPLDKLNQSFRAAYKTAREATLARSGPVILAAGDKLTLLHGKDGVEAVVVPPLYHRLKAVAHGPFAAYLLLAAYGNGALNAERLDELRTFHKLLAAAGNNLDKYGFSPDQLPRQRKILSETLTFLDGIIKQEKFKKEEATAFARRMEPLVLANAAEAAALQIDGYHAQVSAWQKKLPAADWDKLHVIIQGSALPRPGNLAVQYFAWLLGEKGEGRRIVYAESVSDEARALNLLGTHLLDRQAAAAFFDDDQRLHRDLLADAATAYLKKLKKVP